MTSRAAEPPAISATRNSLLQVPLAAYKKWADKVEAGYVAAAKFLHSLKIFNSRDLPYQTQLVPLAAILAELGTAWENDAVRQKLAKWYWCGVFGELYGSAVESRFALDIRDFSPWINGGAEPQTVQRSSFEEKRLQPEIDHLLAEGSHFLTRPISLPTDALDDEKLLEALQRLCEGKPALGFVGGLFAGKIKAALAQVTLLGESPRGADEWLEVQRFIDGIKRSRKLAQAWNHLVSLSVGDTVEPDGLGVARQEDPDCGR